MITGIKHIAIAVADAEAALKRYQMMLGAARDAVLRTSDVTRQRSVVFMVGDVQYQLVQSLDKDGRYAKHVAEHGESIHHICYTVDDLKATIETAVAQGARMLEQSCRISDDPQDIEAWDVTVHDETVCQNCGIKGRYEHPEGWVAFLEDDGVPGAGVEFMQVYKPEEIPEEYRQGPLDL
ncbi:MAG: VOC family protein [Pseudomonadota bacterium]